MLDPMTAAPVPALQAEARAPEWDVKVGKRTYDTQAEANAGSIAGNLAAAAASIREVALNPELLGNVQFTTELDAKLDYLHGVSEILAGRGVDRRAKLMVSMGMVGEFGDEERAAAALISEVSEPLDLAAKVDALKQALALLGPRPEAAPDPEQVAMLAWIRRNVAPRREERSIVEVEMPKGAGLLDKLAVIAEMDESGEEGVQADLPDWVPGDFTGGAANA